MMPHRRPPRQCDASGVELRNYPLGVGHIYRSGNGIERIIQADITGFNEVDCTPKKPFVARHIHCRVLTQRIY
jgi:hypothetical protein